MKIHYTCDRCGEVIDFLEVAEVDEAKFGFDCLTADERRDIIRYDEASDVMHVRSLCDQCIDFMGLSGKDPSPFPKILLH